MTAAPKQFTLSIALGNGGMNTPHDVASALERVANHVEDRPFAIGDGGNIRDPQGDVVGRWQVI